MKYLKGELKFKDISEVLWLDIESCPIEKELTEDSVYWNAWYNKVKYDDKIGDTNKEIIKSYNEKAGLYREFSKIVSVSYGIVRNGKLKVKNVVGNEVDIINTLFADIDSFRVKGGIRFLGVFSGKQFDIPFIHYRAVVNKIVPNELVDTGGLAPWSIKHVIDVQDILRGGGMTNLSLNGVCASFGIPSPKDGEVNALKVRDMYYSGNIKAISEYNNKDVLATCNAFLHYLNKDYVEMEIVESTYVDEVKSSRHPLTALYRAVDISEQTEKYIRDSTVKMLKKDRAIVEDLLCKIYINNKMFQADKPERKESKKKQIKELLE